MQVLDRALNLRVVAFDANVGGDVDAVVADIEHDPDRVITPRADVPGDDVLAPGQGGGGERMRLAGGCVDLGGREQEPARTGDRLLPAERVLGAERRPAASSA